MTQIGLFLFFVAPPKVAEASTSVSLLNVVVVCVITPTFANVNTTYEWVQLFLAGFATLVKGFRVNQGAYPRAEQLKGGLI
jgi:hypothetical protein